MKDITLLTMRFLYSLILFAPALIAFGAEPVTPERPINPQRGTFNNWKPGSILVFNLYSSSLTDPGKEDTEISVTNINPSQSALIHIFFLAANGSTADSYFCLTPNQTISFLASDVDPGVTGYILAHAMDSAGCPVSFNFLIGSEYVKLASGHAANLPAETFAALFNGTLPGCSASSVMAVLSLDGIRYNAAPSALAVDKFPSLKDGNSTLLVINKLEGNLGVGIPPFKGLSGVLFDDAENAAPFSYLPTNGIPPQFKVFLSDDFPQTTPKFSQLVSAGRTGWMRIMANDELALCGAIINFHSNAATARSAFNGGHNLYPMQFREGSFITPVFAPSC